MFGVIEGIAVRRVALSVVSAGIGWLMSHVSGHYGITINPQELQAATFVGLEYARHWVGVKYPDVAPWLN